MNDTMAAPAAISGRIAELDIIRGFALFGVLWMNLFGHAQLAIPPDALKGLATAPIDKYLGLVTSWLAGGKAQALFSMLFGFGFAILTERAAARGVNASALYFRRLLILFLIGLAHYWLIWMGDILHAYALMGLLLLFTRRWPGWLLLSVGIALAGLATTALGLYANWGLAPGQRPAFVLAGEAGAARRWVLFQASDYPAYVSELMHAGWAELYSQPLGLAFLSWILGRFLIGAWIYRQGWLQDTERYAAGFRRWAPILLGIGLAMAAVGPTLRLLEIKPTPEVQNLLRLNGASAQVILALGYGAGLVMLCQREAWRRRLSGLGAVGQMALTNYLMQSLVFLFVLYGFGLGLLPYAGATFCLGLTLAVFGAQILFSRWWLARYRFGPAEWAWRSLTYGKKQPMRLNSAVSAPSAPRPLP